MSAKEQQHQIDTAEKDAKKYATDNKKLAVLYWKSDHQVDYMDADKAREAGITPVKFVSWL